MASVCSSQIIIPIIVVITFTRVEVDIQKICIGNSNSHTPSEEDGQLVITARGSESRLVHPWEQAGAPVGTGWGTCRSGLRHLRERAGAPVGAGWGTCGNRPGHLWERAEAPVGAGWGTCGNRLRHLWNGLGHLREQTGAPMAAG